MSDMDAPLGWGLVAGFLYIGGSASAFAKLVADLSRLEKGLFVRLKEPLVYGCHCL
jgi:hypothetical protein